MALILMKRIAYYQQFIFASSDQLQKAALAYKQVLSLFIAHRRPSEYLISDQNALKEKTNTYLNLLYKNGIIPLAFKMRQ